MVLAQEEARRLNNNYIGTEHLLLGLLHGPNQATEALVSLGVDLDDARARVAEIIGNHTQPPEGHIPFTPPSKKVLELSLREAMQLGHNHIGTGHVLLGLLREGDGVAAQVLVELGVDLRELSRTVLELTNDYVLEGRPGEGGIRLIPESGTGATRMELQDPVGGGGVARVHVQSGSRYEGLYGFSRGVRHNNRIEIAGTAPIPAEGEELGATAYEQMIRCGQIALEAVVDLGGDPSDVIRTVMYITDPTDADEIGRAHEELFGEAAPAATMVVVAALLEADWKVELEVSAQL